MSVWISDEKLLIFASLISPSKMILFEKKYQTFDTVFHHQMKHCVSCLIYYLKDSTKICILMLNSHCMTPAAGNVKKFFIILQMTIFLSLFSGLYQQENGSEIG